MNTVKATQVEKPRSSASHVKSLVIWVVLNGTLAIFLIIGVFLNVEWALNIVKFDMWVNFIVWFIILLGGKKSWERTIKKRVHVGPCTNSAYGILFAGVLASAGFFGYAAMEITTLILQNAILFGDDIIDM